MDRAVPVPADFNPVYPYEGGARNLNLMPPFYSSDGFGEGPTSVLTLDCANPISVDSGKLGLKVGPGLNINSQGELQSTGTSAPLTEPPISYASGKVGLSYANPLTLDNSSALGLKLGQGLTINTEGQLENTFRNSYTFVSPLETNLQSQVSLVTENPVAAENGKLTLLKSNQFGVNAQGALMHTTPFAPLEFDSSGALLLKTISPLEVDPTSRSLGLKTGSGLAVTENGIQILQPNSPLTFTNDSLALLLKSPLQVSDGHLSLGLGAGLGIDNSNNLYATGGGGTEITTSYPILKNGDNVSLTYTTPLKLDNNGSLTVDVSFPLRVRRDGYISLGIGDGLAIDSNNNLYVFGSAGSIIASAPLYRNGDNLSLNFSTPLYNNSGSLDIRVGGGLKLENQQITADIGTGLKLDNQQIAADIGTGLKLENQQITADIGDGLTIDENKIVTNIGAGMELNTGQIQAKLGEGLTFDQDNAISLSNLNPSAQTYTLWTTADPSPNVDLSQPRSVKMWLTLTRTGDLVTGSMALEGLISPDNIISLITPKTIKLIFDTSGQLVTTESNLKGTWGFKLGNSIDPTSTLDARMLMPNQTIYPLTLDRNRSDIIIFTKLDSGTPCTLRISLNNLVSRGYSMDMKWMVEEQNPVSFISTSVSFVYNPDI